MAHQLGNSLGLAVLMAHRVTFALSSAAGMLALALLLVMALLVRPERNRAGL